MGSSAEQHPALRSYRKRKRQGAAAPLSSTDGIDSPPEDRDPTTAKSDAHLSFATATGVHQLPLSGKDGPADRISVMVEDFIKARAEAKDSPASINIRGFLYVPDAAASPAAIERGVRALLGSPNTLDPRLKLLGGGFGPDYYMLNIEPKPQDEYGIVRDISNRPFPHIWLKKSEDGRPKHPMEEYSVQDIVYGKHVDAEPLTGMDNTPVTLVQDLEGLEELVKKLQAVDEFSVDLAENNFRSYQGMTCLFRISTRAEDYVIDTFNVGALIGPLLREIFKDPSKTKIMHGKDDILHLQRDFDIYVCNMFDTKEASRVLDETSMNLNDLFKKYLSTSMSIFPETFDWRYRPLYQGLLENARFNCHHLLRLYIKMKSVLLSSFMQVYQHSYNTCIQLYEKKIFTPTSFLNLKGLKDLNADQLSVAAGLYKWRDEICRLADESTEYVLPDIFLLQIALMMPTDLKTLTSIVKKCKCNITHRSIEELISVIQKSIAKKDLFQPLCQQMKQAENEWETGSASNYDDYENMNVENPRD